MRAELIVALDVPNAAAAAAVVARLGSTVSFYKIGLELFCAAGPRVVESIAADGKQVFLDLKLHDIPRTVARAVRAVAGLGATLLTVHASGGRDMIAAAAMAVKSSATPLRIIAVTMLTSLDQADLRDAGIPRTPEEQVQAMAELALAAGADGLVASPNETARLRRQFGPGPLIVTPGIRLPTDGKGDQKRVGTPADAVRAGASFLVVGRPILEAPDPAAAARQICAAIAAADSIAPA